MDYKEFMSYMEPSGTSHKNSISGLQNYVREFPYFQTAQALLAKALREQEHVRFDKQLKIAAAYCGDRKSLYALIHHKPSSIFIETVSESPFVSSSVLPTIVQEENPFTETPVFQEAENRFSEVEHISTPIIFEPIVSTPIEQNDSTTISDDLSEIGNSTVSSGDPRDIIRERLKEILGKKEGQTEEDKKTESIPTENNLQAIEPSVDEIKNHSIGDEKIVETIVEIPTVEGDQETISSTKEIISESPENNSEEIIQRIAKESENRNDEVDRGELEYALEATIIHSLENLPLLDETKVRKTEVKIENVSPLTFFDWLKQKNSVEFGKVEEVHADDVIEISKEGISENISDIIIAGSDANVSQADIEPENEISSKKEEEEILIDKFIATEPRIVPSKTEFYSPAKQAQKSLIEHEDLVSETLARIYRLQGAFLKARSAYQKLILLHPEKKAYFAALIEEIDNQYNNPDKQDL